MSADIDRARDPKPDSGDDGVDLRKCSLPGMGSIAESGELQARAAAQILRSEMWELFSKSKWSEIVTHVGTWQGNGKVVAETPLVERAMFLFRGAEAALKIEPQMLSLAERYISDAEKAKKAFDKEQLKNGGGNGERVFPSGLEISSVKGELFQKLQFKPETVLKSKSPPNSSAAFRWRHASGFSPELKQLADDIYQLCVRTGADSAVVIFKGEVVPYTRKDAVFYHPRCAEVVPMMSSTKSIGGLAAFMMQERALLNLDATVDSIMPEWGWADDPKKSGITVRHLLTHTSGLPGNSYLNSRGLAQFSSTADIIQAALQHDVVGKLGEFDYSNPGSQLLSPILDRKLEATTWGKLDTFIRQELFVPLGMARTRLTYDDKGNTFLYADLLSTPLDFARVGLMVLNGGVWEERKIIDPRTIRDLVSTPPDLLEATRVQCGHLWWRESAVQMIATRGYLDTSMYLFPNHDVIVVRTQWKGPEPGFEAQFIERMSRFLSSNPGQASYLDGV